MRRCEFGRISRWLAAAVGVALPWPVRAQALEDSGFEPTTLALAAIIGAIFGLSAMAAAIAFRGGRSTDRGGVGAGEDAWLTALAGTAREGYFAWGPGEPEGACSARLAELIGLDPAAPHVFGEVAFRFRPEDALVLGKAVENLRETGRGFLLTVATGDGRLALDASGLRVAGPDGAPLGSVVWFTEARTEKAEIQALDAIADATSAERDRLQSVLDAAPFPAWQRDAQLKIIWCNRAYGVYAGASVADVLARGIELDAEGARGASGALADRARRAGRPESERRTLVVEGEARTVEIVETPIGRTGETAGFARDVTELAETQADLDRHIARQADLLEHLTEAVVIYDAGRRVIFHNAAYARLWGLDRGWLATGPDLGEIMERLRADRRLPEQVDFPAFKQSRLALFSASENATEGTHHLPDGRSVVWRTFRSGQSGLAMIFADVTEQLSVVRDKATVDASLRLVLDNLESGVSVFGPDGRLKLFNAAYARLWNLDEAYLETLPHVADILEAERPLLSLSGDWDAQKSETLVRSMEFAPSRRRVQLSDGRVLDLVKLPLPDGTILFKFLDITDSERVARALQDRADALEAADRFKRDFLANASYDLRTPLTSVIGFAELLQSNLYGPLTERQQDYTRAISGSSAMLLDLIDDILDLAGAEMGGIKLDPEAIDLHEILGETLDAERGRADARGVALDLDCATDIGDIVADEKQIKRAIDRLLVFAIERTAPGESVVLGASREAERMTIWVADGGEALTPAEQADLFEPFAGAARGSLRRPGGGVGLTLARRVVELHGGAIEAAKDAPRGVCVIVRLPAIASVTA